MSVPGRIGTILIIGLALLDALMLASGAKRAASAVESHAALESASVRPQTVTPNPLLSKAIREINLYAAKPRREIPQGI